MCQAEVGATAEAYPEGVQVAAQPRVSARSQSNAHRRSQRPDRRTDAAGRLLLGRPRRRDTMPSAPRASTRRTRRRTWRSVTPSNRPAATWLSRPSSTRLITSSRDSSASPTVSSLQPDGCRRTPVETGISASGSASMASTSGQNRPEKRLKRTSLTGQNPDITTGRLQPLSVQHTQVGFSPTCRCRVLER
jgi:hypothetical protein